MSGVYLATHIFVLSSTCFYYFEPTASESVVVLGFIVVYYVQLSIVSVYPKK
jgi:hypothetical protein